MIYAYGPGSSSAPQQLPPVQPTNGGRPSLDSILRDYQVQPEETISWKPNYVGWLPFAPSQTVTKTEGELLSNLQNARGLVGLNEFKGIRDDALRTAQERYPGAPGADSHLDAFRHAYWNALMVREYGEDFARDFATAHEGSAETADSEAMDLYNNEVGRRIAVENPDASPEELANLIQQAVDRGEMVVIDGKGELAWSDQVAVGQTGTANDPQTDGGAAPPDGDSYPEGY